MMPFPFPETPPFSVNTHPFALREVVAAAGLIIEKWG